MKKYERYANYHETDQMGVIHHSNFIKWMEEARVFFLNQIGLGYNKMEEESIVSPVTSITIDYKKTVKFNDVVIIDVIPTVYNGVKAEFKYEFVLKKTNELCCVATSKHCFIKDGKIVSLKKVGIEYHNKLLNYCNELNNLDNND